MNRNTFKKILLAHKDNIYHHAYYFSGNREDAEDITQDAFIKLWKHRKRVKKESVIPWLLKVTRNLCIDYQRKRRETGFIDSCCEDSLYDRDPGPEQCAVDKDALATVMRVMDQLPEVLKSILIMRDIQDFKYSDIAVAMDIPLNSVKVYLHRGRKLLMKKLNSLKNELTIGV
ncbi:MAG: RNA polymerase sigma factor [candidate division KSB1 bacterium]|jgi:RNA polymerase sigma-70 factor (ECF subfamily)|nr:RNA polymerase sigma factor [candidate division KSB1 bacterium]